MQAAGHSKSELCSKQRHMDTGSFLREPLKAMIPRSLNLIAGLAVACFELVATGCGGGGGSMTVTPISVSLDVASLTVSQSGAPVAVHIDIISTSETALVAVNGLPAGLQVKYSATDTNPSGTLAFTASAAAPTGTYKLTVTVNSAGQTASTSLTLVVAPAATGGGTIPARGGFQSNFPQPWRLHGRAMA